MNLLVLALPPDTGLTHYIARLSGKLKQKGINVVVAMIAKEQHRGLKDELREAGIKIYEVADNIDYTPLLWVPKVGRRIGQIISLENVDIVHSNGFHEMLAGYLGSRFSRRRPPVVHHQGWYPPLKNWQFAFMTRTINKCSSVILPMTESIKRELLSHGLSHQKSVVLHKGIDFDEFYSNLSKKDPYLIKELDLKSSNKTVTCIADYRLGKGYEYYLKAAVQVLKVFPNTKFLGIGQGPLKEELEAMANDLGISDKVVFTGYLSSEYIPKIFAYSDVSIVASLRDFYPRVLIESLSVGTPVVTTPVGAAPQLVTPENNIGYLVPKEDTDALAQGIIALLSDPLGAKQMGERGKRLVQEQFSLEREVEKLEEVYQRALRQRKGSKRQ